MLMQWLELWWHLFKTRLPSIPPRWHLPLALLVLAGYTFFLRSIRLFDPDHFYVLKPDSHYFHWLAARVMAGEGPPVPPGGADIYTWHSGLAYPIAYIAKAASFITGASSAEALEFVTKFLPPLLGVVGMLIIFAIGAKMYNRRIGLLSSFAWAAIWHSIIHGGAAGNIDRDVLNMLLVMTSAFLFYLSKNWRFNLRGREVGWLIAALTVLALEAVLYLEWNFIGPTLLLIIITAYSSFRVLMEYFRRRKGGGSRQARLAFAVSTANWRVLAVIIVANVAAAIVLQSQLDSWASTLWGALGLTGWSPIGETQGARFVDFVIYLFFVIPMAVSFYLLWHKREEGTIFVATWFVVLAFLALFTRRAIVYAVPAACLLSGVGLSFLWDWGRRDASSRLKQAGVIGLLVLIVLSSFIMAYSTSFGPLMSLDRDWRDALTHLKDETPEESVVMAWWSYGYWILDVAERRPVVDGGYYGWDIARLKDIRTAYLATDTSEAADAMRKRDADYLIFSELDLDIPRNVQAWPLPPSSVGTRHSSFPPDSLVARTLAGDMQSDDNLEVWYTSPDSKVFILRLAHRVP